VTRPNHNVTRKLVLMFASLALFATACGGGVTSEEAAAAEAAAAENASLLEYTESVDTSQVLTVADGSITTLSEVVTGDRPVLLWYWAPH